MKTNIKRSLFAAVFCLLAVDGMTGSAIANRAAKLKPPFEENFASTNLSSEWIQEISPGGKIFIKDNWITFESSLPQRSHIERPLDTDNVTISAKVVRWSGIYLVWDDDNWCGVGKLSPTPFGRIYSIDVTGGKTNEADHRGIDFNFPHTVRVQIGSDHVRFQYLLGKEWQELRTIERPKGFSGAPKVLRVGKYYGTEEIPYGATNNLAKASGAVRELRVEATPKSELKLTKAELKSVRNPPAEPVNALLSQSNDDPTYEKIVGFYPPMKHPREIVGVPIHPLDIGVDWLGRLDVSPWTPPLAWFEVGDAAKPFGESGVNFTRRLLHGYLPVLSISRVIENVNYEMTVFGWSENFSPTNDLFAYVRFTARPSANGTLPQKISMIWANGKRTFQMKSEGERAQTFFRFKYPEPATATELTTEEFDAKKNSVVDFWKKRLEPAESFSVPDARVMEGFCAWIVYSMLNTDLIEGFPEPHDGAGFYEQMFGNSVSLHTAAMDMFGFHNHSEKVFETQIHFQDTNGLYTQVCGLTDPGGFLYGLARHYEMTGDKEWLKRIAPNIISQCDWLMRERDAAPKEGMVRGLIKFRPYNDHPDPVYNYLGNVWCAQGMKMAAAVLKEIGIDSQKYKAEAEKYRQDILNSMDAAAVEHNGQTVLPMEPDTHRLLKMSKYKGGDYWGLIASPLLGIGLLEPDDKRAMWIVDLIEKRGGLVAGVCEFQDGIDHAYTFGYLMNAMKRGEVRKTLLGFWSMQAFGMTRDTYSPVEVTMIKTGENHYTLPHLYSCTDQLRLFRNMLLHEDENVLWIGQGIPRAWLEAGKHIAVKSAPTQFGEVSYRIDALSDEQMRVAIAPPSRRAPQEIRIQLRHPSKRKILSVSASPNEMVSFEGEIIVLKNLKTSLDLDVRFAK
jgi:hypothetical protein